MLYSAFGGGALEKGDSGYFLPGAPGAELSVWRPEAQGLTERVVKNVDEPV